MKVKEGYREVIVQVHKDEVQKLDEIKDRKGSPRSVLIREAIRDYIKKEATA